MKRARQLVLKSIKPILNRLGARYIFLSEEWEMYVTWHVMIPPYDWARIYLRHRYNQTAPTYAFEISSVQEQAEPQAIEVPDWV